MTGMDHDMHTSPGWLGISYAYEDLQIYKEQHQLVN